MYGYDISNWQKGMSVSNTLHDFAIFKASEGATYRDPTFTGFMNQKSKYRGAYHYLKVSVDVEKEVANFLAMVKPYLGKIMLAVDVEDPGLYNAAGVERTRLFLNSVKAKTGVTPFVYTSLSWENALNWGDIVNRYPLWVAQYNDNRRRGYNAPDLYGTLKHWKTWTIHQYTSAGQVSGYAGKLDLNISKGDWRPWVEWCKQNLASTPKPVSRETKSGPAWVKTKGTITLKTAVRLRTGTSVNSTTITLLPAGSRIKYDAAIIVNGYRWVRQPRGKSYGYIATGPTSATLAYVK